MRLKVRWVERAVVRLGREPQTPRLSGVAGLTWGSLWGRWRKLGRPVKPNLRTTFSRTTKIPLRRNSLWLATEASNFAVQSPS